MPGPTPQEASKLAGWKSDPRRSSVTPMCAHTHRTGWNDSRIRETARRRIGYRPNTDRVFRRTIDLVLCMSAATTTMNELICSMYTKFVRHHCNSIDPSTTPYTYDPQSIKPFETHNGQPKNESSQALGNPISPRPLPARCLNGMPWSDATNPRSYAHSRTIPRP